MDNNQTENLENQQLTRNERIVTANIIANIVMMLFGAIAIYAFLSSVQSKTSIIKQQENNSLALTEVVSILDKNTENSDSLTDIFHQGNWKTMDDIELLFRKGLFEKMMANENIVRAEMFTELSTPAGISYLFLCSSFIISMSKFTRSSKRLASKFLPISRKYSACLNISS